MTAHIGTVEFLAGRVKELEAEVVRLREGMELAWGIIANASGGNWDEEGSQWKAAAERWRDEHWHPAEPSDAIANAKAVLSMEPT